MLPTQPYNFKEEVKTLTKLVENSTEALKTATKEQKRAYKMIGEISQGTKTSIEFRNTGVKDSGFLTTLTKKVNDLAGTVSAVIVIEKTLNAKAAELTESLTSAQARLTAATGVNEKDKAKITSLIIKAQQAVNSLVETTKTMSADFKEHSGPFKELYREVKTASDPTLFAKTTTTP